MGKILCGPILQQSREELLNEFAEFVGITGLGFAYIVPTIELEKTIEKGIIERLLARGIKAFEKPLICSFDDFIITLAMDLGLYREPLLPSEQRWVIKQVVESLLANGNLVFLSKVAEFDGFYLSVQRWLNEIKGSGQTPDTWLKRPSLTSKERELGVIYAHYEQFLADKQLIDHCWNYEQVIRGLETRKDSDFAELLQIVVVDGFYKLNQLQLRVLNKLHKIGIKLIFNVFQDHSRSGISRLTTELLAQIMALETDDGEKWDVFEREGDEHSEMKVLGHLRASVFSPTPSQISCDPSIQIIHTPDRYLEIEEIGREIKRTIIKNPDLMLRDIGIIVRDIEDYQFYIRNIFSELGINYHLSEGIMLYKTPVFKLILNIYNIFVEKWSRESLLTVMKSQYLQIADELELSHFEQIILDAGIIKGRKEWKNKLDLYHKRLELEDQQERIVYLTRLMEIVEELLIDLNLLFKDQSIGEHCERLLSFLNKYALTEEIVKTTEASILRRDLLSLHHLQKMLSRMIQFAERINTNSYIASIEVHKVSYSSFLQLIKHRAQEIRISEVKVTTDAVQIMTPSESRGQSFKMTFVGGLMEGEFPAYDKGDWLFTTEERRLLKAQGVHIKQSYEVLEEERLFFFEAVSTAKERLVLSCPGLTADETLHASSFIQEVLNIYDDGSVEERELVRGIARGFARNEDILTLRELDEKILRDLWQDNREYNLMKQLGSSSHFQYLDHLYQRGQMIKLREGTTFSVYDGVLENPKIISWLQKRFSFQEKYSISQINDYAVCPFQFFCKRVLNLDEIEEPVLRLEPLDLGNLYHKILYRFFWDFQGWADEKLDDALHRMKALAEEVFIGFNPGKSLPKGLWMIYQEEIKDYLDKLLRFEYAEAAKQKYQLKPCKLEVGFGLGQKFLEEGQTVQDQYHQPVIINKNLGEDADREVEIKFQGKIDRIDMSLDGRYLVIYDYKFGGRDGMEAMDSGVDLQLPIYIKAAQEICGEDKVVLGAGYFSIKNCNRESGIWKAEGDDLIPVSSRKKNCLNQEEWDAFIGRVDDFVVQYMQQIRNGEFRVNPVKDCPSYCKFKRICRYDQARIGMKQSRGRIQEDGMSTREVSVDEV